jgi:peptidoglycan/LPS O-acetylase OafA/YrhL
MENKQAEKLYYIEILKVLIIGLLIPSHTALIFFDNPFCYIRDSTIDSQAMDYFFSGCGRWMMYLMFFLSGISVYYSLKTRTVKKFIIERLKRLYVPLVFCTICFISIQTFLLAKNQYGFSGSFFDFFPKIFFNGLGMTPKGYFNWGHLWFLCYLFHFSLLALPFFIYCLKDSRPYLIQKILQMVQKGSIILPLLLLIVVECAFRAKWPGNLTLISDWANFFLFFTLFVYGFLYAGNFINVKSDKAVYPYFFFIAVISMIIYLRLPKLPEVYNVGFISGRILAAFNTWACIVFLVDFAKHKLNFKNFFIKYASDLSAPVYLIHYPVLTILGYYVVQLQIGMTSKILLIMIPSYIITIALCEIVKRVFVLRFLLGLK